MPLPTATPARDSRAGDAWFSGVHASDVVECVDLRAEPERVAAGGWWAVVGDFEGQVLAWRFARVRRGDDVSAPRGPRAWEGPAEGTWSSSLDQGGYEVAVARTRAHIRSGEVYQANICRVLAAPLPRPASGTEPDPRALAQVLRQGNPATYAGGIHVPAGLGLAAAWVVTASPELFLRIEDGTVTSGPIKGTGVTRADLQEKDRAENIMITDLVRNDLQQLCEPGSVDVPHLLAVEEHPGFVHLVSTVSGTLRADVAGGHLAWDEILAATYPPASVSGAPKSSALRVIAELEPTPRGPYCGAVGWIDSDAGRAELAVGIRTFWWSEDSAPGVPSAGTLRFGTGAGITWGSDPGQEWQETELKARRLIALATGSSARASD